MKFLIFNFRFSKRGVSIYLALIIMSILLSIGLGVSLIIVSQARMIREMENSVIAFHAADTGIEQSLYERRILGRRSGEIPQTSLGDANYSVTYYSTGNRWVSVGNFSQVKRAIEISYPGPACPITLYPSGAGTETSLHPSPSTRANWNCVDETPADDTDFVSADPGETGLKDIYITPSPGIPTGSTINSVTVYWRGLRVGFKSGASSSYPRIRALAQAITDGNSVPLSAEDWTDYSQTWTKNPQTGVAWTVNEVNDLDIGVGLNASSINWDAECSQVYAVIDCTR